MLTAVPAIARDDEALRPADAFVCSVLDILHARTGIDFGCYRAPMLQRRIANRVSAVGAGNAEDYLALLRTCAIEPYRLLERITIKVSRFYRHAPTFNYLHDVALPALARQRAGQPLRIWCVGCGTGEEPYTYAMLLEQLGIAGTVQATDIDNTALQAAEAAHYPINAAAELPPPLRLQYLEPMVAGGGPRYRVREDICARVRFAAHDVTSGAAAPVGEPFDLVSCRNVLIYLQRPAQLRALHGLLASVRENGLLCLGEAEWPMPELAGGLEPLPHKTRLFRVSAPAPFAADHELNRARLRMRA